MPPFVPMMINSYPLRHRISVTCRLVHLLILQMSKVRQKEAQGVAQGHRQEHLDGLPGPPTPCEMLFGVNNMDAPALFRNGLWI